MNSVSKASAVNGPPEVNLVVLEISFLPIRVTKAPEAGALPAVNVMDPVPLAFVETV